MKTGKCKGCGEVKLLTKHSTVGGHAEGLGYEYICRDCHDEEDNCKNKRKKLNFQKGSGGKYAKGTQRSKRK